MALSVIFTTSATLRHSPSGNTYTPAAGVGAVSVPIAFARGLTPTPNQPAAFFCFTGTTSDRPSATAAPTLGLTNTVVGYAHGSITNPVIPGGIFVPPLAGNDSYTAYPYFGMPFYDTTLSKMISFCGFQATSTGWCDQAGNSA